MRYLLEPGEYYPRSCKLGHGDPTRGPHCPAYHSRCQRHRVKLYGSLGAHNTISSSFRYPPKEETPPVEPITLPTEVDVNHTPLDPAETLLGRDAMVLLTKSDMEIQKNLLTGWAISPIKVETQVVLTTRSVVKLAGPLAPFDQSDEERRCVLIVTASI